VLKETVNGMTESLSMFTDEVTRVAGEVGNGRKAGGSGKGRECRRNMERPDGQRERHSKQRGWSFLQDYIFRYQI